jgi:hypothetical protein
MPSSQFSTLLAATMDYRQPEVNEQIFDGHPVWKNLMKMGQIREWTEGGDLMEAIISANYNSTFAPRDYKTPVDLKEVDPLQVIKIDWREISGTAMWYERQVRENSSSKTRITNLVNAIIDNAKMSCKDVIGRQVWESGTGETLHGMPAFIDHDNTYANLSRTASGYTWWKANDTDAGHTSFTRTYGTSSSTTTFGPYHTSEALVIDGGTDGGLTKIYDDCCANGGDDSPNLITTSYVLYNKLRVLMKADSFEVRQNKKAVDLGWPEDNFVFRGATVIWDRNCTSTDTWLLNTKHLQIMPYKGYRNGPTITEPTSLLSAERVDAEFIYMKWGGNLLCLMPQRFGRLSGKTV